MRSHTVVVEPPLFKATARFFDADEQMLVEAFIATLAVEALDEGVLHRLTGSDEAELDVTPMRPRINGATAELGAVIAEDRLRCATLLDQTLQDLHPYRPVKLRPGSAARHSRLKSSATLSTRKRRPSAKASIMKSIDQR